MYWFFSLAKTQIIPVFPSSISLSNYGISVFPETRLLGIWPHLHERSKHTSFFCAQLLLHTASPVTPAPLIFWFWSVSLGFLNFVLKTVDLESPGRWDSYLRRGSSCSEALMRARLEQTNATLLKIRKYDGTTTWVVPLKSSHVYSLDCFLREMENNADRTLIVHALSHSAK